jgi:transposase-like protein
MKKNKYSPKFKSNIALNVIENQAFVEEIAQKHALHISLVRRWEKKLRNDAYKIFKLDENEEIILTQERDVL